MRTLISTRLLIPAIMLALPMFNANAAEEFTLVIKDHKFEPEILEVPANTELKITIKNMDDEAEEFDSYDLHREKFISGKKEQLLFLTPLEPGEYEFIGEKHKDTAKGKIIAR